MSYVDSNRVPLILGALESHLRGAAGVKVHDLAADLQRFLGRPVQSLDTFAAGVDEIGEESESVGESEAFKHRLRALMNDAEKELGKQRLIGSLAGAVAGYFV